MRRILFILTILLPLAVFARERENFDSGWEFAFGDTASPDQYRLVPQNL